jgi:hypothetical protein
MSLLQGKKTYLGILVAALPTIAGLFGYNVSVEGSTELVDLLGSAIVELEELITAGGLLFAAYGRRVTK